MTIRRATTADAPGIARVHVETWRSTYQGLVPDDYLAGLSIPARQEFWDKLIRQQPPREHLFVAEDPSGKIVGMISGGRNRSELPYDGEVKAIYVLKENQGQALGRRLFQASVNQLADDGFRSFMVWVLEQNPACGFYTHQGGRAVGEADENIGGKTLKELAFAWDDLQRLTTAKRIYHITDQALWRKALGQGIYEHPSLKQEGFIHASERSQLLGVANRYFQKVKDLLVLELDASRLQAPLRFENTTGGTELFPHIYGPIHPDAVLLVHTLEALCPDRN
ncbi:MAG TPA: GNAT family N-acetyltransferase [Oligoflexus sp.]|uniref:GNAT family N-acetyltransferase n=1 Tax=Oligoflexus sp. TaxID=1971216 RepID=UPI002D7FE89B|nr:GNAT family N-acetyltransferase [Oligoflexus sp.]HET9240113.1 GNAT family N-acetyltransferase [Oligoflexus sp.]